MMTTRGRIKLTVSPLEWMNLAVKEQGTRILDISPQIAFDSCLLTDFHGDTADRIITSTARLWNLKLITKDRNIRLFSKVRTAW